MKNLALKVEPGVFDKFPEILVGGFLVGGLDEAIKRLPPTDVLGRAAHANLINQGLNVQNIVDDDSIRLWRNAYKEMGLKPSTFKSSVEALARRALKGESISTPLPVVNVYCSVSTRYLSPLGGYDLSTLPNHDIAVRFAHPSTDTFSPLGGRPEDMPVLPSVVVYGSGNEILCWAFNHRDSKKTCLHPETRSAVFFGEAIAASQHQRNRSALQELRNLLADAGAVTGDLGFVDKTHPYAGLTLKD